MKPQLQEIEKRLESLEKKITENDIWLYEPSEWFGNYRSGQKFIYSLRTVFDCLLDKLGLECVMDRRNKRALGPNFPPCFELEEFVTLREKEGPAKHRGTTWGDGESIDKPKVGWICPVCGKGNSPLAYSCSCKSS